MRFHCSVGYVLLEAGHFDEAQKEFDEALKLSAEDQTALNGRYLSNLFLSLNSPDWDPAIGFAIQKHLSETGALDRERHRHIIDKYLGDLNVRVTDVKAAKEYYAKALAQKADYIDALFTLGWLYYEEGDVDGMETSFRKMTEVDLRDFRGFHGLGYTLYMKVIRELDADKRSELITEAARQSGLAKDLIYNQLHIVMDFGEVARSVNPGLSLIYHEFGKKVMDDPVLSQLEENRMALQAQLLMSQGQVIFVEGKDAKMAWIEYQTALDHLAIQRNSPDEDHVEKHEKHLEKAKELDPCEDIYPIYLDQLTILDLLLPEQAKA
jgi:tetratricopeptide (TPR) repeat protein